MKTGSRGALVLGAVLIAMVLAASWAPESQMSLLPWIPSWAADWADQDPNIRTAIPFVPLAVLLGYAFVGHVFADIRIRWALTASAGVCVICLALSELGQVFLPNRTADWKDLLWGAAGILIGTVIAAVWSRRRRKNECEHRTFNAEHRTLK